MDNPDMMDGDETHGRDELESGRIPRLRMRGPDKGVEVGVPIVRRLRAGATVKEPLVRQGLPDRHDWGGRR